MLTVSADLLDWIWSVMNEFISPLSDWISIGNFIISRFHSQICSSFQPCFHPVYMFWPQIQLYASASRHFIFPCLCTTRCIWLYDSQLGHCLRVLICNTQRTTGLHIYVELFFTECISQAKTIDLIINSNACQVIGIVWYFFKLKFSNLAGIILIAVRVRVGFYLHFLL